MIKRFCIGRRSTSLASSPDKPATFVLLEVTHWFIEVACHGYVKKKQTMNVQVTNCSTCAFSCFSANQCTPQGQTQTFIKLKICCHRNKTASLIIHLQLYFSAFQNRSRELVPSIAALIFVKFEQDLWERSRDILGEVFMVRNPFKTGQYWCSAVIYRKPNAFSIISFF